MSKSSVITVDNKETGKKENVYWKEEKYYYGEKLIESREKRYADRCGGLVWCCLILISQVLKILLNEL
ncbi:hypothetical protein [Okeania hirsuta]|uniref:hypothetical protein n=1 Tax=Okeania hirsuta TaxID=1458930 RepID=UPI000F51FD39|nr:hypothetical protein [Okeania hirsuta]RQH24066.1 hypothetical protein D4Z78_05070 [Okeania hirsuta]